MAQRVVRANIANPDHVSAVLSQIRQELQLEDEYPAEALADIADVDISQFPDHTDIPFITIDPPGAADLDQAMHLSREGDGYLVRYAISAVSLFVPPGSRLDEEIHERGTTVYGPDGAIPLHPRELSAGKASLLENQVVPTYLWYLHLDQNGALTHSWVEFAQVKSVAQLTYEEVQEAVDNGTQIEAAPDLVDLLEEIGKKRLDQEIQRGGISLDLPEQIVEENETGYYLRFRAVTDVEEWNAQISLLTGMAAADMMLHGGIGILRTMPEASQRSYKRIRYTARALGIDWPADVEYPDFVRSLDSSIPAHAAFMTEAITLFRGASYLPIGVGEKESDTIEHAAIAAPYAHVTAPLRRLVDRYGLEICRCLCAEEEIPAWVKDKLPQIPKIMNRTGQIANKYERKAIDALEALILAGREGEEFDAVVVDVRSGKHSKNSENNEIGTEGTIMVGEPAVKSTVYGENIPVGRSVTVRLEDASKVEFELVRVADEG